MFTRGLSQFINNTNYENLPLEVIAAAKPAILDHIGVAMAGSQEPSGRIVDALAKSYESKPEATVIGGRFGAVSALAAWANGNAAHTLDYDDCLDFPQVGLGHPSTGILPAALAISESHHLTGKELITAYCVAVEVYAKVGLLTKDAFRADRGWEWTGVLGVMGAAAAVTKLLKLNEEQIMTGLGVAASLASGLTRNFGSMAGHLHAGNAARNGVEVGLLVSRGFTAYADIIETAGGFYNLYTANNVRPSDAEMKENLATLGNPWNIIDPGLMFKAFPLAHISHFGVDAALRLRREQAVDWRRIAEIEFHIPTLLTRVAAYSEPKTGVEGKFSLGYCACRTLIGGEPNFSDFTDESVKDPDTKNLMKKINWVVEDQKLTDGPFGSQELILKMDDGRTISCRVNHPRGEPQNPLTREEHAAKYRKCATHAGYNEKTTSRIEDLVFTLENLPDVSQLMTMMAK